ncbi:indoleamine 2,3-dioxygenase [Fusarium agapanthi]|uniref:Indoleamine 2,3-dioxygenase n=1 Tax=Fusarium agapanthi TaxID=1803897 RepID=A0A9P5AZ40_9HYPO|nr:indoleamine 2,3-dioxygenase [Fusarium agapanthi]
MSAANTLFPHLRKDPSELPEGEDPFTITTRTGYLPFSLPLKKLPSQFDPVSNLLNDIPILKEDGTPGLLATFALGPLIDSGALPDLTSEIDNLVVPGTDKRDMAAITAAFRDYSFIASSYLLEPCWETYSKSDDGGYGLGRQTLPKCIAGPLVKCAEILDIPAFMSYAASYALYNYWLVHPEQGHDDYDNIRLVRAFEKGLDPKSSEAGFILTHIHMVAQTGGLIEGAVDLLAAVEKDNSTAKIAEAKASLELILTAMQIIETNMEGMWSQSLPKDYMTYRTFIYGITKQSMFPDGVVYEGQYDDKPQFFRGESGANDAIIPLLDHICEIPMPKNPLTDILVEFREYRPKPHRAFLKYVRETASEVGVRDFLTKSGDHGLAVLYLRVLDHIRSFRWRHWMFTREYIIKHTLHPTATGGSPIITWLPNQLTAVMDLMEEVAKGSGLWAVLEEGVWSGGGSLTHEDYILVKKIMDNVVIKKAQLKKEVDKYCQDRGV